MSCTFDNRNRDTFCDWSDSTPDVTKTYDAAGRVLSISNSVAASTFSYDAANQVLSESITISGLTGAKTVAYSYDADGNRTIVTGAAGAGSYTANDLNQYTTAGGVGALTYDANGNLATGGGWTYTHNGSSRLVGVSGPGSVTATFGRDGCNRDVKRTINGTKTYLIYDGWSLVAEYDAAGGLTTRYIHGPQVDEIVAKVTTTSTTFPLPDALGSTIAVTDSSGAMLERVYYSDAFGAPTGVPLGARRAGVQDAPWMHPRIDF
jgi:YD repeat-containing protein